MTKSYMQTEKECYLCRKLYDVHNSYVLHEHHIFEGNANRSISEKMGAKVWLCPDHHNMSNRGIHYQAKEDWALKQEAQRKFEETHSHEEFMELIGRNFIGVDYKF